MLLSSTEIHSFRLLSEFWAEEKGESTKVNNSTKFALKMDKEEDES